MTDILNKLKEWIKVIEKALIGAIVVETVLVIIIGVASNKVDKTFDIWTSILIFCSLIYVFLVVIRALYQLKFPGSIIEELQSKRELEEKNKLLNRQTALNGFINSAIKGLNKQTCNITVQDTNKHLCDQELAVNLKGLLQPIVEYTDVILDTSTDKQFTIGIHLDAYQKFPEDYNLVQLRQVEDEYTFDNWEPVTDKGILILKDELELSHLLPKELVDIERINGTSYEIQTSIKRSLNNLTFDKHKFTEEGINYTIICSEILEVCSDDFVNGVMFIIYKNNLQLPSDISDILKIFSRVTSNFASRYNSCIMDQIINHKLKNP